MIHIHVVLFLGFDVFHDMTISSPYFFICVATRGRRTNSRDGQNRRDRHLDHFITMRLGIPSGHGKDSDLLCLGAAVGQR